MHVPWPDQLQGDRAASRPAKGSTLRCLDEQARAIDVGQSDNIADQRGRQFYGMVQNMQDSPFRGIAASVSSAGKKSMPYPGLLELLELEDAVN